jgi:hypothetical protein
MEIEPISSNNRLDILHREEVGLIRFEKTKLYLLLQLHTRSLI